jgi:S1-C subfamily serine protease
MRRLLTGMVAAMLAAASYPGAAAAEGRLGAAVPTPTGATAGPAPADLPTANPARGGVAYGRALSALRPEGRLATRGAKETEIYRSASPSVVLIVTRDGLGSGVLIDGEGRIVTNHHVVEGEDVVGVVFKPLAEGAEIGKADVRRGRVIRRDEVSDLALVQVAEVPAHVKPLVLATDASIAVGADVHAIGHPTGEAWTYTRGIVSQVRRDYAWTAEDRREHKATVIQTQTPINPGNSGGPLLDDQARVVGINSFGSEGEGLNFAVAAEEVAAFLARTEDRRAAPAAPEKPCDEAVIDERPSKDPRGMEYLMDSDCDGRGDYSMLVPASKRDPIEIYLDDDGDGKLDTVIVDDRHDGKPDRAFFDTDGDGQPDLRGDYRNGEDEPYRFEKINR